MSSPMFDCEYLGGAVHVIRIVLVAGGQCDMSDRLHWVGQGEQHLALLAGEKQQHKWENRNSEGGKKKPNTLTATQLQLYFELFCRV